MRFCVDWSINSIIRPTKRLPQATATPKRTLKPSLCRDGLEKV